VPGLEKASLALQDGTGVLPIQLAPGESGTVGQCCYLLLTRVLFAVKHGTQRFRVYVFCPGIMSILCQSKRFICNVDVQGRTCCLWELTCSELTSHLTSWYAQSSLWYFCCTFLMNLFFFPEMEMRVEGISVLVLTLPNSCFTHRCLRCTRR
jgi:hypothetical protein